MFVKRVCVMVKRKGNAMCPLCFFLFFNFWISRVVVFYYYVSRKKFIYFPPIYIIPSFFEFSMNFILI